MIKKEEMGCRTRPLKRTPDGTAQRQHPLAAEKRMPIQEPYGCLPGAYTCEHQVTNPFVDYLNEVQGSNYIHLECPDKIDRDQAAPDALYQHRTSGSLLVVEHKALVWPPFFAERHRNDHLLMDRVSSLLDPEIAKGPFVLELPYLLRASRSEIATLASQICAAAEANKVALLGGGEVSGTWAGRNWRLHEQDFVTSDWGEGIGFTWNLFDPNAYKSLRVNSSQVIQRLCDSAVRKFGRYAAARRILLLELVGDVFRLLSKDLMAGCVVPNGLDEIWTAYFETFDDGEEDWVYDIRWPCCDPEVNGGSS